MTVTVAVTVSRWPKESVTVNVTIHAPTEPNTWVVVGTDKVAVLAPSPKSHCQLTTEEELPAPLKKTVVTPAVTNAGENVNTAVGAGGVPTATSCVTEAARPRSLVTVSVTG
jgi:hypothetical protein